MKNKMLITVLLLHSVGSALAQTTEDAVFQPGPSTEDFEVMEIKTPVMHEVGSVFSGSSGIETPSMDVPVQPMPPYAIPGEFSPEFVANLKAGQLKNMIRLGWIKPGETIKLLASKRSAQEDLEFYSFSVTMHHRAISEGKPGDFYVVGVKNKTISFDKLKRDIEVCGINFEIYDGSGLCSIWRDHQQAEQHYRASLDTIKEKDDRLKMLLEVNNDIINRYEASVRTIQQLQAQIKKLKKGRR